MTIQTRPLIYDAPGGTFEGVIAWDDAATGPRPGVLVSHNWMGQDDFDTGKAIALAELGYVGFAIDLYGQGRRATNTDEAMALAGELGSDRAVLQARINRTLELLRGLPEVDAGRTAAIGFCLGGKCVLDLARSGADVDGVVSFHGVFDAPPFANKPISAKVLVLHGFEDPLATPDQTVALGRELTDAGADWQIHMYGNTSHAFTAPGANNPDFGLLYDAKADRRSWQAMRNFLDELWG
ncbi:Dienelactone hydrolase [Sphingomonas laterariae]|uniref:Dienelactone hydrolase n=1 Tax=Edaphosphingomonas laterariae TaxID=861865 RepID=A0A239GPP8_9SPHN|nr:dienelactone hydrolase family protein [Sphingomonas laterariae]SNS70064.1 Dienelactone hydrolase [Sphingomonas laterariae]